MKKKILIADLTHTASGIFAAAFPLGASLVCSYAEAVLGDLFDFRLFKMPDKLSLELSQGNVHLLGLTNYAWNMDLNYKMCAYAKSVNPGLTVVFGGPNLPVEIEEKREFLARHPLIDFYIENDGEYAFVKLLDRLSSCGDAASLKGSREPLQNCCYLDPEGALVRGEILSVPDLAAIPSPYLTGLMDEFFELPMIPLMETTRGCPFSCLYCADGVPSKSKVRRHPQERVRKETDYIAERVKGINMLMLSDLNFGMYEEDILTSLHILGVQREKQWPVQVGTAAGKNKPERVRQVVTILGDSWRPGASIQSSDPVVLANIRRDIFNKASFEELIRMGNALGAHSYSDIILAIPGDSKATHFESLRYCIDNQVSQINLYQAMLLHGADMSTRAVRDKYQIETRFRIRQGTIGSYRFGNETVSVCETEEIVVATRDMPFSDYLECRFMDLIIEIYVNCALYEEVFALLRGMQVSIYDVLYRLYAHQDTMFTPEMKSVFRSFLDAFHKNLYPSRDAVLERVADPAFVRGHLEGSEGGNELLDHKAMLYLDLEGISGVLLDAIRSHLEEKGMFNAELGRYLEQLMTFLVLRKRDFRDCESVQEFTFDYDFGAPAAEGSCAAAQLPPVARKGYTFFHNPYQKKIIQNEVDFFNTSTGGLGRLLQQGNLKKMYRDYQAVG